MARLGLLLLCVACVFLASSARPNPSPVYSQPSASTSKPGPILTNGRNYTYVCDRERFASLSLNVDDFGYCNKSLSFAERVADLVGRMTLAEKIGQLGDMALGSDRIGLPPYNWWSEALHGVSFVGHATYFGDIVPGATSFPVVILSAATFNESLWKKMGEVVSTEARAMYNLGHTGLTFWSPNINVVRDPRWGRTMETPGEDPLTVGIYAKNYVRGLQDVEGQEVTADLNTRPLKVSSCCKHYAAYDLESWLGVDRVHFDARVTEQDMVETFLRPFEICVKEGDVSSVMCSFNRVNGIPVCTDPKLFNQTIRGDWGLHGYIVSDCDSLEVIKDDHKWLGDTEEDVVAQAFNAGLDLDCGIYYTNFTGPAVAQGRVRESSIDNALTNNYMVLMRVGYFDGSNLYDSLGTKDICTDENMELAADAARQGLVLLKNENNVLPLSLEKIKTIALVGPHANATDVMIGNYEGVPCRFSSPLDAFSQEVKVNYQLGCDVHCKNESLIFSAMEAAKNADATLIFVGLDLSVEAEWIDRTDLLLPGYQTQLIRQVADVSKGPVVLVVLSGGVVDIEFAESNPKVGAIIWAGYPGGRSPLTWYQTSYVDSIPMTSMKLRPIDELGYPGRTYKFFNGSTIYPFGHGLSYTTYNYTVRTSANHFSFKIPSGRYCPPVNYTDGAYVPPCPSAVVDFLPCSDNLSFEVEVANIGNMDGGHVVMVYSKAPDTILGAPSKQVVAFQRVYVPAGKSTVAKFDLNLCKVFGIVESSANIVLPAGQNTVIIGNSDTSVSFPVQIDLEYELYA
ncbi:hypothetical protein HPP92_001186 [Vanilla planifolia]|uniref:Fibronectin type III-like domain-containing protein n=1 Tax=Vanilla planifolia TaxID=51239 RepID=A0A835VGT7_VANPL|nr:hypothetical protein HPP92_001186 [Vanilla planifolia]